MSALSPAPAAVCTCNPHHHKLWKQKKLQGSEVHTCLPYINIGIDRRSNSKQGSSRCVQLVQGSKHASLVGLLLHEGVTIALHKATSNAVSANPVAVCVQLLHCMHLSCEKPECSIDRGGDACGV